MRTHPLLIWLLRIIPAGIMLQTLWFKFSASAESVFIFSQLGVEPLGRIGTGALELVAALLLLLPAFTHLGAVLTLGLMSGALFSHLFKLGIVVQDDGGLLFAYALISWLCAAVLTWLYRHRLPLIRNIAPGGVNKI